MFFTRTLLMSIVIMSFALACTPKKRSQSEAPTSPLPTVQPLATPPAVPMPTTRPFRGGLNVNGDFRHSQSEVAEEELRPIENYDPKNAENLERSNGPIKRFTGFKDSEGNSYTDAANDLLVTFLRKYAQSESGPGIRAYNLQFADTIREVRFKNPSSGNITIKLKLLASIRDQSKLQNFSANDGEKNTNGTVTVRSSRAKKAVSELTLSGRINNRFAKLRVSQSTATTETVEGAEFRCLDLDDSTCETSLLRIYSRSGALADVVLRNTIADVTVKMNEKQNYLSDNFKSLRRMFYNTLYRTEQNQPVIEKTVVNSFAVINGRSEVRVKLVMDKAESLLFKSPLIAASQSSNDVSVIMKQNIGVDDLSNEDMQKCRVESGFSYADMIEEAKLTKNNGLGQIQITLKLKNQSSMVENEEPILLKIFRITKPIVDLDEDSIFFEPNN